MRAKKANNKLIGDLTKQLQEENLYSTDKDALLLQLLDNAFTIYSNALDVINEEGAVIQQFDDNRNLKSTISPQYRIYLDMHKEITKMLASMYLTPQSRNLISDNLDAASKDNPITKMINSLKEVDKKEIKKK